MFRVEVCICSGLVWSGCGPRLVVVRVWLWSASGEVSVLRLIINNVSQGPLNTGLNLTIINN